MHRTGEGPKAGLTSQNKIGQPLQKGETEGRNRETALTECGWWWWQPGPALKSAFWRRSWRWHHRKCRSYWQTDRSRGHGYHDRPGTDQGNQQDHVVSGGYLVIQLAGQSRLVARGLLNNVNMCILDLMRLKASDNDEILPELRQTMKDILYRDWSCRQMSIRPWSATWEEWPNGPAPARVGTLACSKLRDTAGAGTSQWATLAMGQL